MLLRRHSHSEAGAQAQSEAGNQVDTAAKQTGGSAEARFGRTAPNSSFSACIVFFFSPLSYFNNSVAFTSNPFARKALQDVSSAFPEGIYHKEPKERLVAFQVPFSEMS